MSAVLDRTNFGELFLGFDLEDDLPEATPAPSLIASIPTIGGPAPAFAACNHRDTQWDIVGTVEIGGKPYLEIMCPDCDATDFVPPGKCGSPRL